MLKINKEAYQKDHFTLSETLDTEKKNPQTELESKIMKTKTTHSPTLQNKH